MMLPWLHAIYVLTIVGLIKTTCAVNSYVALVPTNIRAGTTLRVPIRFLSTPATETVTVTLMDRENVTIETTTDVADGLTFITPELQVPGSVGSGQYWVVVQGNGSVPFVNATRVYASWKSMAIFVQTDKATYKPGDTMQYRVFAINSSLDIIEPALNIELKDPNGNKIDERMNVSSSFGIVGELALSDMPPLGEWSITVEAPDFINTRTYYSFGVEQYVLPKYEITVILPPFATLDMPFLTGSVKAIYTFGKPVYGNLRLTVTRRYSSGFFDARAIVLDKTIDGEVSFNISMSALRTLSRNLRYDSLVVHANVTEQNTGFTLGGQSTIRFHENPYRVEFFPNLPDYFKTTFNPYEVLVKVVEQDNRPPVSPTEQLQVTVTYYTDRPLQSNVSQTVDVGEIDVQSPFPLGETIILEPVSHPLQPDGTVSFDLIIPESAATATIKAAFKNTEVYKELKRFRSPGKVFLQANLTNANNLQILENDFMLRLRKFYKHHPRLSTSEYAYSVELILQPNRTDASNLQIKDVAGVELLSTEGPVTAQFIVVAKGQVVYTGDIRLETLVDGQYRGTGAFAVTREMAPAARLVAYYVRGDGEIVAEGQNFVVKDMFENQVAIEIDQSSPVTPQMDVNIRVTAENDSYVHVLGVDQSVLLKRTGNDITPTRVTDELRRFGNSPWIGHGWGERSFLPWPLPGADDASDIFRVAQLNVLTDAWLHTFDLWQLNQPMIQRRGMGGARMMSASFDSAAGAGMGGGNGPAAEGFVRKDFPETWSWKSGPITGGSFVVPTKAPDTITTFVANAFALSPTKGLGIAPVTANLTVFLPFFVNIQLPYSVVRGEIAIIQASIFNYHPEALNVLVTLIGSGEFIGVSVVSGNEVNVTGNLTKCVQAPSGRPVPVFFSVRPTIVGSMTVNVRISARNAIRNVFDDVTRILPVKAEGAPREKNQATLFSFQQFGSEAVTINVTYPADVVPQSQQIRVTAIGDLFGPSLRNLDKLLKMPYGCGEQNMLNFAPAVFAAAYLQQTNRAAANAELIDKITNVLRVGYQRQLVYQRRNGSFSTFGNADDEGSLWLTAFVVKSFAQAHKLGLTGLYIDPNVIDKAIRYIVSYQQIDGSFVNTGIVHHKSMQGGSTNALTAFVLIALQEVKRAEILTDTATIYSLNNAITEASFLLIRNRSGMTTDYERAIGSYALKLVNSTIHAAVLLSRLERSVNRVVDGTMKHWTNPSATLQIELAAYTLLTYASMEDEQNGFPILNWLVKQGNGHGGFISTQDTVIALQALSEFAGLVYTPNINLTIDFSSTKDGVSSPKQSVALDNNNHDLLQYKDFDGDIDTLTIEAKGTGLALVDVNMDFNVYEEPDPPSYVINLNITEDSKTKYTLKICASYNITNSRSNMAIMDIGVISGFEPVMDQVTNMPIMKRREMSSGRLVIYFDEIPSETVCVSVPVQRVSLVAGVKSANVLIYTYYEPEEKTLVNYMPPALHTPGLCDTCGAECGCPSQSQVPTAEQALELCNYQ